LTGLLDGMPYGVKATVAEVTLLLAAGRVESPLA
jgi:hypothetical protein